MNKKITLAARFFMGLVFFVFGLNGFFQFMPMPPLPEEAGQFMGALGATGYFFPFLKICEILGGALLLFGAFVPFALTLLAPIIVNIFLFHFFLAPSGLALPVLLALAIIFLGLFSDEYSPICKNIFRCPKLETMKAGKK